MSVFVAHDSTLYTLATGLRQQAFGDVNEPWPSTSLILSQPFLITTAIVPIVIKWRAMYSHCFFGFAASWFVSLFLNQRALLFVSPRWLLLVLWLAAAAPHTTLNRAIHILSMHVAHGCVIAKQCCMAWLELAHGAVPQNPVVYYCHVAKGMCVHQLYLGHFGWQERWTWDFFNFFFTSAVTFNVCCVQGTAPHESKTGTDKSAHILIPKNSQVLCPVSHRSQTLCYMLSLSYNDYSWWPSCLFELLVQ